MRRSSFMSFAATIVVAAACTVEREQPNLVGQDVRLTFIHTSDIHSRLFPYNFVPNRFEREDGLLPINAPFGGIARISSIAQDVRATSNRSLWLDSGDCFQGAPVFNMFKGEAEMRALTTAGMDAAVKGGYPHFMLKEIHEQPTVIAELTRLLDASRDVAPMAATMKAARHLYYVGCGTSYHACVIGAVYAARIAGRSRIGRLYPPGETRLQIGLADAVDRVRRLDALGAERYNVACRKHAGGERAAGGHRGGAHRAISTPRPTGLKQPSPGHSSHR